MYQNKKRYLLCPQCLAGVFYIVDETNDEKLFFHVYEDLSIEAWKEKHKRVEEMEITRVFCKDCSWKGPIKKLVK